MRYIHFYLLIGFIVFVTACGSDKADDAQQFLNDLDESPEVPAISEETINDILQQIPAPTEISMLLKESGTGYDREILNKTENASNYNTTYKRAVNLGLYGTDLMYINIFGKDQDAISYMRSVKLLADGLNIGQFFDIRLIAKLAGNSDNIDSLMLITTQNFNAINRYLQENKRSNLSILFLAGGWLEGVYINAQMALKNPDKKELAERVGEQKMTLESILMLLSFYAETDSNIKVLYDDMTKLKAAFEEIEITYTYAEPTTEIVDGMLMVVDNSSSNVLITNENIVEILRVITELRKKITA